MTSRTLSARQQTCLGQGVLSLNFPAAKFTFITSPCAAHLGGLREYVRKSLCQEIRKIIAEESSVRPSTLPAALQMLTVEGIRK